MMLIIMSSSNDKIKMYFEEKVTICVHISPYKLYLET